MLRVISFELPCAYFKHLNDHPRFSKTVSHGLTSSPPPGWPACGKAAGAGAGDGARWMERSGSAAASVQRAEREAALTSSDHQRGLGLSPGPGADSSPRTLLPPSHCRLCQVVVVFFFFFKTICSAFTFSIVRKMQFHLGSFSPPLPHFIL